MRPHDTIYWEAFEYLKRSRKISLESIAKALGLATGTASHYFNGSRPCPARHIGQLAELLSSNKFPKKELEKKLRDYDQWLRGHHGIAPFRVRVVSYGHLEAKELSQSVQKAGTTKLSGPGGFLIDCFANLLSLQGGEVTSWQRCSIRDMLRSGGERGEVLLCHLAALNMIKTSHFFCTPISIGIGGLVRLRKIPQSERSAFVQRIRHAISDTDLERPDRELNRLRPICFTRILLQTACEIH
jgi:hypothetical protein